MTEQQAHQIAQLLNTRNRLAIEYTPEKVLDHADDYIFELCENAVIACVKVKRVQWYQWEVLHLSVREDHENRGLGKLLIYRAENLAILGGARIVQCTIRVGNEDSERVFRQSGYREACCFFNASTKTYVAVWQKVVGHRA